MDTQVGNCSSEGKAFFPALKMRSDRLVTCTGLWPVSAPEELDGTSGTQGRWPEGKGCFLAWEPGSEALRQEFGLVCFGSLAV